MKMKICIVGLGYVGLPLACEFGKKFKVYGFDINKKRVSELKNNYDYNKEVSCEELKQTNITYSSNPNIINKANFVIVAIPTPVDNYNNPDINLLCQASKMIGKNLQKNSIVVYESTVAPGTTEEVCVPIIQKFSGLKCGKTFQIGYSPERLNPGDKNHSLSNIIKIVSANNRKTLTIISKIYRKIITAGVYEAESIKIAEAAKIIENTQRDLNIALMNEFYMIFDKMNIDFSKVLSAAKTKWNFLPFYPGLVGGHCIGVDPYYLADIAKKYGHHPQLILAGRKINNLMAKYEFNKINKKIKKFKLKVKKVKILILGVTFKPNVKDLRNSKVKDLILLLKNSGYHVDICEPMIPEKKVIFDCHNINLQNINSKKYTLIIKAVPHRLFLKISNNIYHLFTSS